MSNRDAVSESLFRIRVNWPLEYMPMVNDIVRVSCIQLVAQFMFYMMNGDGMFSVMFVQTLCFLLLGVLVYWLIVHKIVRFETTQFPSAKTIIAGAVQASEAATNVAEEKSTPDDETRDDQDEEEPVEDQDGGHDDPDNPDAQRTQDT